MAGTRARVAAWLSPMPTRGHADWRGRWPGRSGDGRNGSSPPRASTSPPGQGSARPGPCQHPGWCPPLCCAGSIAVLGPCLRAALAVRASLAWPVAAGPSCRIAHRRSPVCRCRRVVGGAAGRVHGSPDRPCLQRTCQRERRLRPARPLLRIVENMIGDIVLWSGPVAGTAVAAVVAVGLAELLPDAQRPRVSCWVVMAGAWRRWCSCRVGWSPFSLLGANPSS